MVFSCSLPKRLNVPHTGAALDWFITHPLSGPHVQYTTPLHGIDHPERDHQENEN